MPKKKNDGYQSGIGIRNLNSTITEGRLMFWHIICIVTFIIAAWSAWGTWQNTMAIKSILKMTDDFNGILQKIIEHAKMQ